MRHGHGPLAARVVNHTWRRLLAAVIPPRSHSRRTSPCVQCKAKKGRTAPSKAPRYAKDRKGFGEQDPRAPQEPWEKELLPPYRAYYKASYKPPRHLDQSVDIGQSPSGDTCLVASTSVSATQLLAVVHPIAYQEGSLGNPPSVEDLHAQLLEEPLSPAAGAVMALLPATPPASAAQPGAGAGATAPVAAAHADISELDVRTWSGEVVGGPSPPPPLGSRALMRTLQLSSYSEEFTDPAASQVCHATPLGFIGVWPEWSFLAHSCAPNTSAVVLRGGVMLLHATQDVAAGSPLTHNKLGSSVAAPLAVRQAAHLELFGRPCRCQRCSAEAALPSEVQQQLTERAERAGGQWGETMRAALEAADGEALQELQEEIVAELDALEELLTGDVEEGGLGLDGDAAAQLLAGVYTAYDMAWQVEELLQEEPGTDLLAKCVTLLKVFGCGSESHVAIAQRLEDLLQLQVQALAASQSSRRRRTAAAERRLVNHIQLLLQASDTAKAETMLAMCCRYGLLPMEGLMPQLRQGQALFYEGLSQLNAAAGGGSGDGSASLERQMEINGIPVTVVDTVNGPSSSGRSDPEQEVLRGSVRMTLIEDSGAELQQQQQDDMGEPDPGVRSGVLGEVHQGQLLKEQGAEDGQLLQV